MSKKYGAQTVAVELGFGFSNAAYKVGEKVRVIRFPSVVTTESARYSTGMSSARVTLQVAGKDVHVGEAALLRAAYREPLLDRSRTEGDAYLHLYLAAVSELFADRAGAGPLRVITGLPIGHYADAGRVAELFKGNGTFEYQRNGDEFKFSVVDVTCAVQHFGTVYYYAIAPDGTGLQKNGLANKRVGVIDIGTYTTGFVMSDRLTYIEDRSRSENFGMSRVHQGMKQELYDRYGLDYPLHRIDAVLRQGHVSIYKEAKPVMALADKYLEALCDDVVRAAVNVWGTASDLDELYIAGGGAYLLGNMLSKRYFGSAHVPDRPELTNVMGLLRLGLYMESND